jgi:outer membrane lipoprotein-sorting protein
MRNQKRSMLLRMLLLVFCGTLAYPVALAQYSEDVLEQLRKKYDSINDAQVKFSSRMKFAVAKVEQRTNGTLEFKKEHKYRVELEDQTIVTDGETVWSYSAASNQVLIDGFKLDERMMSPERILTAAPRDFSATVIGREKSGSRDLLLLKLIPKGEQSTLKSMKLWIDDDEWLIRKVEMADLNGTETVYTVNDIRLNTGLEDSRFSYRIPEGATVVDLR